VTHDGYFLFLFPTLIMVSFHFVEILRNIRNRNKNTALVSLRKKTFEINCENFLRK
jgi:hypothetical protein